MFSSSSPNGGGWTTGSGAQRMYNGERLAQEGIVVVTIDPKSDACMEFGDVVAVRTHLYREACDLSDATNQIYPRHPRAAVKWTWTGRKNDYLSVQSLSPRLAVFILALCPVVTDAGPLKRDVEILERIKILGQTKK